MNDKILIVSAYGRGHGLAVDLHKAQIPVVLMEVSESIGVWIPEEIEGPFGFFQNEKISESQLERIIEDDQMLEVSEGFCILTSTGPVEMQGPTLQHRLEKMKLSSDLSQDSWLSRLARLYATNTDRSQYEFFKKEQPLPIFSKFKIRMPTRKGFNKSLDWCVRNGVEVIKNARILDFVNSQRNTLKAVEYRIESSEKTQLLDFSKLIWCLSLEETLTYDQKIQQIIYTKGGRKPEWSWSRYRIKISEGVVRDQLPLHCILINDLDQPWTHENFLILIKTAVTDQFDVWIRIPSIQMFNKSYLEHRGNYIIEILLKRLIGHQIEIVHYPIGHGKIFSEVGPSRHTIFSGTARRINEYSRFDNILFFSYEQTEGLGLNFYLELQKKIYVQIIEWWNKILLKRQKKSKEIGA